MAEMQADRDQARALVAAAEQHAKDAVVQMQRAKLEAARQEARAQDAERRAAGADVKMANVRESMKATSRKHVAAVQVRSAAAA